MPEAHSKNSASNFEADMLCPGRRTMQKGLPDRSSKYADWGTAAHEIAPDCLTTGAAPEGFLGRRIAVGLATVAALVSGLAPGREAWTEMVG